MIDPGTLCDGVIVELQAWKSFPVSALNQYIEHEKYVNTQTKHQTP